ncbi:SDR family oxidoreductase [Microbaculum marinum]|uniref:SDR family oxidoreductase n=1 Tax=Microbaculum marinum TaxID=1764581 RepID=A0AAW9RQ86_9HYPH
MAGKLDGMVAIVTGASSGVGTATARKLADAGATVALVARRIDRLEALAAEIPGKTSVHGTDLYDPAAVQGLIDDVVAAHGRIDILVNNAGSMLSGPLADADPDDLIRMTDLNFVSPVLATHAVVPAMRKAGAGHLVYVSSLGIRLNTPGNAVYAATKSALKTFAEVVRKELIPDNIRVTTIVPGFIETEIVEHVRDATMKKNFEAFMGSMTPLKPEDVAESILYALVQPPHVSANDIVLRPTNQPS